MNDINQNPSFLYYLKRLERNSEQAMNYYERVKHLGIAELNQESKKSPEVHFNAEVARDIERVQNGLSPKFFDADGNYYGLCQHVFEQRKRDKSDARFLVAGFFINLGILLAFTAYVWNVIPYEVKHIHRHTSFMRSELDYSTRPPQVFAIFMCGLILVLIATFVPLLFLKKHKPKEMVGERVITDAQLL